MTQSAEHAELLALVTELNADEIYPLLVSARRIAAGRRQYGALDLENDTRDFRAELQAELVDGANYACWNERARTKRMRKVTSK